MNININGKEQELKFTFNSFKYMTDFNLKDIELMESKPFMVVPMAELLLLGALNHNPKVFIPMSMVDEFLEEYISENSINDLLAELMGLLQDSSFFKSLQKTNAPVKKK